LELDVYGFELVCKLKKGMDEKCFAKNREGPNVKRVWIVSNYNCDPSGVIAVLDAPFVLCQQGDSTKVPQHLMASDNFRAVKHTGPQFK